MELKSISEQKITSIPTSMSLSQTTSTSVISYGALQSALSFVPGKGPIQIIVAALMLAFSQLKKPRFDTLTDKRVLVITGLTKKNLLKAKIEVLTNKYFELVEMQREIKKKISSNYYPEEYAYIEEQIGNLQKIISLQTTLKEKTKEVDSIDEPKELATVPSKKRIEKINKEVSQNLNSIPARLNPILKAISTRFETVFESQDSQDSFDKLKKMTSKISSLWNQFKTSCKDQNKRLSNEMREASTFIETYIAWKIKKNKSYQLLKTGLLCTAFPVIGDFVTGIFTYREGQLELKKQRVTNPDKKSSKKTELTKAQFDGDVIKLSILFGGMFLLTPFGVIQTLVGGGILFHTRKGQPEIDEAVLTEYVNTTLKKLLKLKPFQIAHIVSELKEKRKSTRDLYINDQRINNKALAFSVDELSSKAVIDRNWRKTLKTSLKDAKPIKLYSIDADIEKFVKIPKIEVLATNLENIQFKLINKYLNRFLKESKKISIETHINKLKDNIKNLKDYNLDFLIFELEKLNSFRTARAGLQLELFRKFLEPVYLTMKNGSEMQTIREGIANIEKLRENDNMPQLVEFYVECTKLPSYKEVRSLKNIYENYKLIRTELNKKLGIEKSTDINDLDTKIHQLEEDCKKYLQKLNLSEEINKDLNSIEETLVLEKDKNQSLIALKVQLKFQIDSLANSKIFKLVDNELNRTKFSIPVGIQLAMQSESILNSKDNNNNSKEEVVENGEIQLIKKMENALDRFQDGNKLVIEKAKNFIELLMKRSKNTEYDKEKFEHVSNGLVINLISECSHSITEPKTEKIKIIKEEFLTLTKEVEPDVATDFIEKIEECENFLIFEALNETIGDLNKTAESLRKKMFDEYQTIKKQSKNDIKFCNSSFKIIKKGIDQAAKKETDFMDEFNSKNIKLTILIGQLEKLEMWKQQLDEGLRYLKDGLITIIPFAGVIVGGVRLHEYLKNKEVLEIIKKWKEVKRTKDALEEPINRITKDIAALKKSEHSSDSEGDSNSQRELDELRIRQENLRMRYAPIQAEYDKLSAKLKVSDDVTMISLKDEDLESLSSEIQLNE